jgi:anti-sigma factor RsiW
MVRWRRNMRHVTDGELHAFLDGGLDLLPDERGEEVRKHLSDCAACRERLQDEEAVRSRAQEILAEGLPSDLDIPSFEELRERAEALKEAEEREATGGGQTVRYRGPLRGVPLAWAATIVLALGVGWMGGELWRGLPSDVVSRSTSPRLEEGGATPGETGSVEPDAEAPAGEPIMESQSAAAPAPGLEEPVAQMAGGLDRDSVVARESRSLEASSSEPLPREMLRRRDADVLFRGDSGLRQTMTDARVQAVAEELTVRPEASKIVAPEAPATEGREGVESETLRGLRTDPPAISDSLENSLTVPGLKVVSIGWEERIEGERALLIRQLLPPGDTLELRYLGMLLGAETQPSVPRPLVQDTKGFDEASRARAYANVLEASLPSGWHQVVMERGRGLLVARAPLTEANLKALLRSLR